jgi:tetratricopeptide (TPR) repeat protein
MPKDCRGLETTAASDAAVAAYDRTVSAYLAFARDTGEHLKAVYKADADMPMAHCLKGYFFQLFANPALHPKAEQALAQAEKAADARSATTRERMHIDALAAWRRGDLRRATDLWEVILIEHPLDILALKLAHFTHFYFGDAAELRDSVARVLPLWSEAVPDYGYVLAMRAFGLEESGDYAAAEKAGRRAVELNPGDVWGVHAVAHVLEMQGRAKEGIAWIEGLVPHWEKIEQFPLPCRLASGPLPFRAGAIRPRAGALRRHVPRRAHRRHPRPQQCHRHAVAARGRGRGGGPALGGARRHRREA